ncbi:MAG: sensor histidine kinase [Pseudonocardia sp. 73-21]|nr:MAG: sensor histidine kinase [Pseudonocardia sp. 73-21]
MSVDRPAPYARPVPRTIPLAVTAGVVVAVAALQAATYVGRPGTGAVDVGVAVVALVLVPVLLKRPVIGAVALAVLAAFSPLATPPATIGTLHVARRRPLGTALAVGAVGVAAHAVQGLLRPIPGLPYGWFLVLDVLAHAALVAWGALTRSRAALLESLRERARRAEAEQTERVAAARVHERTRIAREMHDVLAHRLSLVAASAGALEYRPDAPPEQVARAAGVVRAGVHQALEELREVIGVLRADEPEPQRPQPVLADVTALVAESREAGTTVRFEDRVTEPAAVPDALGRTAYRVVQEALTNARRHAPGASVLVRVNGERGGRLVIEVRNDLVGGAPGPPGNGLVGLAERAALAGGRLEHSTVAGQFRLHAALPWPA